MISHSLKSIKELPKSGINSGQLRKDLGKYKDLGKDVWKSGKVSGAVYNGGSIDFNNLVSEAFATFAVSNVRIYVFNYSHYILKFSLGFGKWKLRLYQWF